MRNFGTIFINEFNEGKSLDMAYYQNKETNEVTRYTINGAQVTRKVFNYVRDYAECRNAIGSCYVTAEFRVNYRHTNTLQKRT